MRRELRGGDRPRGFRAALRVSDGADAAARAARLLQEDPPQGFMAREEEEETPASSASSASAAPASATTTSANTQTASDDLNSLGESTVRGRLTYYACSSYTGHVTRLVLRTDILALRRRRGGRSRSSFPCSAQPVPVRSISIRSIKNRDLLDYPQTV